VRWIARAGVQGLVSVRALVGGREILSNQDADELRALLARRRELERACTAAVDELCLATLRVSKTGVSRSQVARALGVGTSTVQGWVQRGRAVRARD
jgi:DNA-binding transcriptional regulator YiaG